MIYGESLDVQYSTVLYDTMLLKYSWLTSENDSVTPPHLAVRGDNPVQ